MDALALEIGRNPGSVRFEPIVRYPDSTTYAHAGRTGKGLRQAGAAADI